jgi:hypothetical protein
MQESTLSPLNIFERLFEPELMAKVQANATLMNLTAGMSC